MKKILNINFYLLIILLCSCNNSSQPQTTTTDRADTDVNQEQNKLHITLANAIDNDITSLNKKFQPFGGCGITNYFKGDELQKKTVACSSEEGKDYTSDIYYTNTKPVFTKVTFEQANSKKTTQILYLKGLNASDIEKVLTENSEPTTIDKDIQDSWEQVVDIIKALSEPETTEVDPYTLFRGKLLDELLNDQMNGMEFRIEHADIPEALVYLEYDIDEDQDNDLIVQAFFQRGQVIEDAFVVYYNNSSENANSEFSQGFSSNNYHLLSEEERPCRLCTLQSNENNSFLFKNRADGSLQKYKVNSTNGNVKWTSLN